MAIAVGIDPGPRIGVALAACSDDRKGVAVAFTHIDDCYHIPKAIYRCSVAMHYDRPVGAYAMDRVRDAGVYVETQFLNSKAIESFGEIIGYLKCIRFVRDMAISTAWFNLPVLYLFRCPFQDVKTVHPKTLASWARKVFGAPWKRTSPEKVIKAKTGEKVCCNDECAAAFIAMYGLSKMERRVHDGLTEFTAVHACKVYLP